MPRVKIKQLDERVATSGLHFGGGPQRRKLVPGEVVEIPEDELLPDGTSLFNCLWATGKLELTMDPVTRPLDYADYREGRLCAPGFKPRDISEETEMEKVRNKVELRMSGKAEKAEKPTAARLKKTQPAGKKKAAAKRVNPRVRRRAATRAALHGEEAIS